LLPVEKGAALTTQAIEIPDEICFAYRGSMLDVGRLFFPVSFFIIGGYLTLEKVYGYEPIPKELNEEQGKYVLRPLQCMD